MLSTLYRRLANQPHPNDEFPQADDLQIDDSEHETQHPTGQANRSCWNYCCDMVAELSLNLKENGGGVALEQTKLPCRRIYSM